jgi:hypothetical protein
MTPTGHDAIVVTDKATVIDNKRYQRTMYRGLRCAGCGRGGIVVIGLRDDLPAGSPEYSRLLDFFPRALDTLPVPGAVPLDLVSEFREAELTASVAAWRAASAMLRSVLEKTLKHNGYKKGSLADKIDEAANDGAITAARSRRAHEDIRVLGNDVLHDAWRVVSEDEYDRAHKYAQRILEDFYDDRTSVETLLKDKGRLPKP